MLIIDPLNVPLSAFNYLRYYRRVNLVAFVYSNMCCPRSKSSGAGTWDFEALDHLDASRPKRLTEPTI